MNHKNKICVLSCIFVFAVLCSPVYHSNAQEPTPPFNATSNQPKDTGIEIYVNQVAYDEAAPKTALAGTYQKLPANTSFQLINTVTGKKVFTGAVKQPVSINDWFPGKLFYQLDFSPLPEQGNYKIQLTVHGKVYSSAVFSIQQNALVKLTLPSVIHYYNQQRANTEPELKADAHMRLYGSDKTVDIRGGWCDASGDVSKYFSHLAYANFMSPQQIPLVTWSMEQAAESIPALLTQLGVLDSLKNEALWGADYMMRALSAGDYFYMIVFSYFNKDPNARRIVGLMANSVTTADYQAAFREGGGMAIAALARIATWHKNGDFTSQQYLDGAKRAFAHLLINNTKYDDDGKENIIDDYCALMAATELWIATDSSFYRNEARKRAHNLSKRMTDAGYFIANDSNRPYWHASDAGMPVVALARYLKKETGNEERSEALSTIKRALDYELAVTNKVDNPFGYARQTFLFRGKVTDGFFIPHENETGWWWQGENARLSSLATAALVGGRLVNPQNTPWKTSAALSSFAMNQISWVLGNNPYSMCFLYRFGKNNVPYMSSNYGHGSQKGGISNGITGNADKQDGSGIDFKFHDNGNEWRWTEQWLPHAAWYLQAIAAMAEPFEKK